MKINKLFKALFLLAVIIIASCSDYQDVEQISPEVTAGSHGVYFPATNKSVFELEPTEPTQITMTIARTSSSGAASVPINVEVNTDNVFVVPATINFADGETEKDFIVSFPSAGEGTTYQLRLSLEGDQYVNPYASTLPYVTTNVTRIKWTPIKEPMVYVDGAFAAYFGVEYVPMYVEAEKAEVTGKVRYRFKNPFDVPTSDPDADGIYDGYAYNAPADYDTSNDYYIVIEIDNATSEVLMPNAEIGVDWSYGMHSIGTVIGNTTQTDKDAYPLGKLEGEVITFPENSLYMSMANYDGGGKAVSATPTYIYLTKEAFIAANMKIEDFNEVEYTAIVGEVGEFESAAYSDSWAQTLSKAIDIDEENDASEYKNLYYLPDVYAEGYGVAFYYNEETGKIRIPENQPIGKQAFGKDVYVSASSEVESSVTVNAKGVTIYTLGLLFHFEDGTILGNFAETFFYSEDAVSYDKADFLGNFVMTGTSQFSGESDAEMNIKIAAGSAVNSLVLTGITYAKEVAATFDPASSTMSIAPQALADFVAESGTAYDVTLYTTTPAGDVSGSAPMIFTFNMQGNLVMTSASPADGYLIRSEAAGGWLDGYHSIVFSPSASATARSASATAFDVKTKTIVREATNEVVNNFKIQGKKSSRTLKKTTSAQVIF